MTNFWFAVVGLFIMAACFIFWPLITFKTQSGTDDINGSGGSSKNAKKTGFSKAKPASALKTAVADTQRQRNIDIFKERLSELESEQSQGTIDASAFSALKLELKKSLLNDVALTTSPPDTRQLNIETGHWLMTGLMTLAVIIGSLSLYALLGRSDDYMRFQIMREQGLIATKTSPDSSKNTQGMDLNKAIAILKEKIQQDPNDVKKWFLLAKSYAATQQYTQAAETFLEIVKLTPKDSPDYAMIKGSYAQALYLAGNEQITPQIHTIIEEVLAIDPQESNALVLKGVEAFQSKQFKQAIATWELAKLKATPRLIEEFINPAIASAQTQLGIQAPAGDTDTATNTTGIAAAKIQVLVDLAPELKTKVNPEQVVFIFARPPDSKMPLAAERVTVKDLPATIVLDDSKAAMPTAKLSSVPTVDVTARISLSGQVTPQPGDLFVTQSEVRVDADESIKLIINQIVDSPKDSIEVSSASPGSPSVTSAEVSTAKIRVSVDIAPELKAKVNAEQIVFVFARPSDSRMPLAAERLTVKDLPVTITLDDSKAAMPTAKLSSVSTVDVTARVSFSGQVMPQAGDYFATQTEVKVNNNESIKLMINQVVEETS